MGSQRQAVSVRWVEIAIPKYPPYLWACCWHPRTARVRPLRTRVEKIGTWRSVEMKREDALVDFCARGGDSSDDGLGTLEPRRSLSVAFDRALAFSRLRVLPQSMAVCPAAHCQRQFLARHLDDHVDQVLNVTCAIDIAQYPGLRDAVVEVQAYAELRYRQLCASIRSKESM